MAYEHLSGATRMDDNSREQPKTVHANLKGLHRQLEDLCVQRFKNRHPAKERAKDTRPVIFIRGK